MNNQIGTDSTGTWTAKQYAIDAGWDFTCIEATAEKGVSSADAEGLTETQQQELLTYCRDCVTDASETKVRQLLTDIGEEADRDTLVKCAKLLGWTDPDREEYDDGEFFSHLCQAVNLTQ